MQKNLTVSDLAARKGAQSILRVVGIGIGVVLMMWAFSSAVGCASQGHGKFTGEHKNLAQARIDGLKAQTEYSMSLQALLDGDLDKAVKHCDKAIMLAPKVARSYVLRGRIMMERNDLQQAAFSLAKGVELDDTFVEAHYYSGMLAERVARRSEALDHYLRAAELDPSNAQYPVAAAEMMIDLDRMDDAEQYLQKHMDTFQHCAGIQQTLGHIAMMRGDNIAAERYFSEARLLAPDEMEVLEDLARVQYALAHWGDAESSLVRLLKDDDFLMRRDLQHMRAQCLVALNRNSDARNVYVELSKGEEGAGDAQAWIGMGQTAYAMGDWGRVRQAFVRVIALAPDRAEGYILRGLHQRRTGDLASAETSFRKAVQLDASAENFIMLGLVQLARGDDANARQNFARAAQSDPSDDLASRLVAEPDLASKLAQVQDN
jgi:Flp pilus assembly protein TadD